MTQMLPGWTIAQEREALLANARELEAMAREARARAALLAWVEDAEARAVVDAGGQVGDLAERLGCRRADALKVAARAGVRFQVGVRA